MKTAKKDTPIISPAKKRGRGKPPYQPTEKAKEQVLIMAGFGMTQEQIARVIGIDKKTLSKHYSEELANGEPALRSEVASNIMQIARDKKHKDRLAANIFVGKIRFGWSEKIQHEIRDFTMKVVYENREDVEDDTE